MTYKGAVRSTATPASSPVPELGGTDIWDLLPFPHGPPVQACFHPSFPTTGLHLSLPRELAFSNTTAHRRTFAGKRLSLALQALDMTSLDGISLSLSTRQ